MRVKNPTGRIDWLAMSLVARMVENTGNPLYQRAFNEAKPYLEQLARKSLGPRNRNMRQLRRYIQIGSNIVLGGKSA